MSNSADNSDSKTSEMSGDENFIIELFKSIDEVSGHCESLEILTNNNSLQLEDFEEKIIVLKAVITEQNKLIQRYSNEVSSVSKRLKVKFTWFSGELYLMFFFSGLFKCCKGGQR